MNRKKNQKGFTLIELLAVIIVLAIFSLIATPIINKVLNNARKNTFKSSVEGMIRAVELDANNNNYEGDIYTVASGSIQNSSGESVHSGGGSNENGTITIDQDGKVGAVVHNKKWCAQKTTGDKKLTITKYNAETCKTDSLLLTLVNTIENKNVSGNRDGLFTDGYRNIRYRGSNNEVKNYVKYNDETWRIIGIIGGKVKIIRENSIGLYPFDSFQQGNGIKYENNWNSSSLMKLLNKGYENDSNNNSLFWNGSSGYCYTALPGNYGMGTLSTCDFSAVKLSDKAKSMIQKTTYLFGKTDYNNYTPSQMYNFESNSAGTPWSGEVMIMYASDYGYAARSSCTKTMSYYNEDKNCTEGNWLYKGIFEWTATSYSFSNYEAASIVENGSLIGGTTYNYTASTLNIRPTVMLKDSVLVARGDGTKDNPYILR